MNKKVLSKSIFLVGPAGCGKSLHSRTLGEKTKLPVINLDIMRHCPRDLDFLRGECKRLDEAIKVNKVLLDKAVGIEKRELQEKRNKLLSKHSRMVEQTRLRELLPNLPNYNDIQLTIHGGKDAGVYQLAFNPTMADGIRNIAQEHGLHPDVAWHNYQKPFEIALSQQLIEQLDFPAIIDFGGGAPISLERGYNKIEQKALDLGIPEEDFRDVIPFEGETLTQETKETFGQLPTSQVVYFKAPDDLYVNPQNYSESKGMERLMVDKLNPEFIGTHQYEDIAGVTIPTLNAIGGKEIDFEAVANNCETIMAQTKTKSNTKAQGQTL